MKKGDYIIIGLIFMIVLGMQINLLRTSRSSEMAIRIKYRGDVIKNDINLDNTGQAKILTIGSEVVLIETKNKKIRMLEMSDQLCPQKICSKTGWINGVNEIIVCLPNQLTIEIIGVERKGEVYELDGISY